MAKGRQYLCIYENLSWFEREGIQKTTTCKVQGLISDSLNQSGEIPPWI